MGLLTPGCLQTCALGASFPAPGRPLWSLHSVILFFLLSPNSLRRFSELVPLFAQLGQNSSGTVPSHIQVLCPLSVQHPILTQFRNVSVFIGAGWNSWRPKVTQRWQRLWQCRTHLPGYLGIKLFDAICLIQYWNNSAPWREGGLKSTSEPSQSSMVLGKGQWTCTEGTSDKDFHPEGVEAWDKSWDRLCSLFAWGYWKFSKALTGLALWPCLEQQGWARDLHAQLP